MKVADLIKNGKFNYEAFNSIPKYKQDVLIVLYKDFLERFSRFKFIFSDKGFRVLNDDDKQEYYCKHYFNDDVNDESLYIPYFSILKIKNAYFIEPDEIPAEPYFCMLKQDELIEKL